MDLLKEWNIPMDQVWSLVTGIGFGIVTLIIGLAIIRMLTNSVEKALTKREVDPGLIPFIRSLVSILLKVGLALVVLEMVGIQATSFIAILGAAGLAIGMALSGMLQNFAGGVIILLFKPYKVGDFINGAGHSGTVKEIQIFNTILKTPDNVTIIIPNGELSTKSLTNFSVEPKRRVDLVFGIAYGDDVDLAMEVLRKIVDEDDRIHQDPEPFIRIGDLADSSVNFTLRLWVNASDYWPVHFDMKEKVYRAFNEAGLNIPFPQLDVHVLNN